jgi:tetratricopeptide (TPR) repeat protein
VFLADYGTALAQAGRTQDAIEQLEKAIKVSASPATRLNLGLVYAESGRTEDARNAFEEAIRENGSLLGARVALARLELQSGNFDEAVLQANAGLEQAPYTGDLLTIWAEALKQSRKLEAEILKLIRSQPEDEVSWYRAAWLYRHKGDDTTARQLFNRLLIRNPQLPPPS